MDEAKIYIVQEDQEAILFFYNTIMAVHAYSLSEYIIPLINSSKIKKLWVDFHKCYYLDSTTIGTLINLKNVLKTLNEELILCNLSSEVNNIIRGMCLHNYFNIIENQHIKNLNRELMANIPLNKTEHFSPEFIIESHNNIIQIIPDMKKEFKSLFKALKAEMEKNKRADHSDLL